MRHRRSPARAWRRLGPRLAVALAFVLVALAAREVTGVGGSFLARDRIDQQGAVLRPPPEAPALTTAEMTDLATTVMRTVRATGKAAVQRRRAHVQKVRAERAAWIAAHTTTFRIASYNVLGSSHTSPGGHKAGMASGVTRVAWTHDQLSARGIDIAGLQEFQPPQWSAFMDRYGGEYDEFHPGGDTENAIIWRRARFEALDRQSINVPYLGGMRKNKPVVLLRDRKTGTKFWVMNAHNAYGKSQTRFRHGALAIEQSRLEQLAADGTPVYITGDFNDKVHAFCELTSGGTMRSAAGGSVGGSCRPPAYSGSRGTVGFDWVFGSAKVQFSNWNVDTSQMGRVSDHALVYADTTIKPKPKGQLAKP